MLLYALEPLSSPHFETELEIIAGHQNAGDEVTVRQCDRVIPSCPVNPHHLLGKCITCRSRFKRGIERVDTPHVVLSDIQPPAPDLKEAVPAFRDIDELRSFTYDGEPIGLGIASSLISLTRNSEPNLRQHGSLANALALTAIGMYRDSLAALDDVQPDLVYLYNGRFSVHQPVMAACRRFGVTLYTHEAAYGTGAFRLVRNAGIHDLDFRKKMIAQLWDAAEASERERVGTQFFTGRRFGGAGDAMAPYRFTADQRRGYVPAAFREQQLIKRIAIFNSSEDEFAALPGYTNPVYRNQLDGLEALVRHDWPEGFHLCVRSHPNLRGISSVQTRRLDALRGLPNVTVVGADEVVDSYALMEAADVVITFGSTAGIEAAYWGTPSILVGRADFEDLGCIRPESHEDVVRAAVTDQAVPNRVGAVKYGYAMRAWGHPYRRFTQLSASHGLFDGEELMPSLPARLGHRGLQVVSAVRDPSEMRRLSNRLMARLRHGAGASESGPRTR